MLLAVLLSGIGGYLHWRRDEKRARAQFVQLSLLAMALGVLLSLAQGVFLLFEVHLLPPPFQTRDGVSAAGGVAITGALGALAYLALSRRTQMRVIVCICALTIKFAYIGLAAIRSGT